jgi:adenylate cyclase
MTDVLFEHHGTLDKFIGDGLMALFGVPAATGDDASNAVRAGARMIEEVERLMAEKPEEEKFRVRIGINTGPVVAGMMGSVKRPEYSVLGDAVNTASRIESLAEPNTVYVGAETYEAVKDRFNFTDMGFHSVKGKAEKIQVFRLER